jgi:hypothetical protein
MALNVGAFLRSRAVYPLKQQVALTALYIWSCGDTVVCVFDWTTTPAPKLQPAAHASCVTVPVWSSAILTKGESRQTPLCFNPSQHFAHRTYSMWPIMGTTTTVLCVAPIMGTTKMRRAPKARSHWRYFNMDPTVATVIVSTALGFTSVNDRHSTVLVRERERERETRSASNTYC